MYPVRRLVGPKLPQRYPGDSDRDVSRFVLKIFCWYNNLLHSREFLFIAAFHRGLRDFTPLFHENRERSKYFELRKSSYRTTNTMMVFFSDMNISRVFF